MVADTVEGALCGTDADTADCNSVVVVMKLLVSGVCEDASLRRMYESIAVLLPVTGDIASGESV